MIIILGSEGRIGKSIVSHLIKIGYKIIGIDIIKKNKQRHLKYQYIQADLSKKKNIEIVIKKFKKDNLKIDCVINCIYPKAKSWGKDFRKIKKEYLDNHFSIHLTDLIVVTRSFLKQMEKQKFGNFIFISSIQGLGAPKFHHYVGTKMNSCIEYSIIKAGIINMTKYLAKFYKGKNIRFNCISIGGINSNQPKKFITNYKKSCLNKGLLDPEDINSTIEYLVSNTSKYVNGQNIIVDDGWSI